MNISGIGSSQGMMGMMSAQQPASLTDDQKQTVLDILADYDSENITASDAQEIFKKFQEAGIIPTKGLKEAIEEAGFDADDLRSMAFESAQNEAIGFNNQTTTLTDEQKELIDSILENYDTDSLTAEDAQDIIKQFQDAGIEPSDALKEYVQDSGYDLEQFAPKGMPDSSQENYFWASQNNTSLNTYALQTLQSILNQYDLSNLTSDQEDNLFTQLNSYGLLQGGSLISMGA